MLHLLDPLLAPVARLMLARGIRFPDFVEAMKGHYVAAAKATADAAGQKITDSRLSALTGLQRRDVARLKDASPTDDAPRQNYLTRLISLWITDPEYNGQIIPRSGPAPSFDDLARRVNRDIHPRTMLDTLLEAHTISEGNGLIQLLSSSYQPFTGSKDQIDYLARNTGDHVAAATENVLGIGPRHFDRAAHYTGLTDAQVDALQQHYRDAQMALLEDLSRRAAQMKRDGKGPLRFRAGGYFYTTDGDTP